MIEGIRKALEGIAASPSKRNGSCLAVSVFDIRQETGNCRTVGLGLSVNFLDLWRSIPYDEISKKRKGDFGAMMI
ncbi:MAG TPA: hypothetical protein VEY51_15025 [Chondromyces sp.]|nr:hypothetical protein [Chondromyces sp.]